MFSNLLHPPHVWFPNSFSQWAMSKARHLSCGAAVLQIPTYWRTKNFHHLPCMKHYKTMWNPTSQKKKKKNIEKLQVSTCRIHQFYTSIELSTYHHSIPVPILSCMFAVEFLLSGPPLPHAIHAVHPAPRWLRPDPASTLNEEYLCWIENLYIKSWKKQHNKNI